MSDPTTQPMQRRSDSGLRTIVASTVGAAFLGLIFVPMFTHPDHDILAWVNNAFTAVAVLMGGIVKSFFSDQQNRAPNVPPAPAPDPTP